MDSIRILAILIFIVVLAAGALWAIRSRRPGGGAFSLLHYHSLGPKRGIAAVKVYDEILVLGITAQSIQMLKSFSADQVPETEREKDKSTHGNFGAILGGLK